MIVSILSSPNYQTASKLTYALEMVDELCPTEVLTFGHGGLEKLVESWCFNREIKCKAFTIPWDLFGSEAWRVSANAHLKRADCFLCFGIDLDCKAAKSIFEHFLANDHALGTLRRIG